MHAVFTELIFLKTSKRTQLIRSYYQASLRSIGENQPIKTIESSTLGCLNNHKTVIPDESVAIGAWGGGSPDELEAYVGFLRQKLEYIRSEIKIFKINGLGYKICTAE